MLVVLMALVVGALLLLNIYENQLVGNLDATLQQRVDDRARLIDAGSDPASLTTVLQEEAFVWIGTASGDVIATGGGHIPIDNPTPSNTDAVVSKTLVVEERSSDEIERETRVMRVATATTQSGLVVVGGSELEGVDKSVSDLGSSLRWRFRSSSPSSEHSPGSLSNGPCGRSSAFGPGLPRSPVRHSPTVCRFPQRRMRSTTWR